MEDKIINWESGETYHIDGAKHLSETAERLIWLGSGDEFLKQTEQGEDKGFWKVIDACDDEGFIEIVNNKRL